MARFANRDYLQQSIGFTNQTKAERRHSCSRSEQSYTYGNFVRYYPSSSILRLLSSVGICLCLPGHGFLCPFLSVCLSLCPYMLGYLWTFHFNILFISLSLCLLICLSIQISVFCPSVCLFLCLSVCPCLSICLSVSVFHSLPFYGTNTTPLLT